MRAIRIADIALVIRADRPGVDPEKDAFLQIRVPVAALEAPAAKKIPIASG